MFEISKIDDCNKIVEEIINDNYSYSIGYNETNDFKLKTSKKIKRYSSCLFGRILF